MLPVSGRPTTFAYSRTGPAVLATSAGRMGCIAFLFNIFHLSSHSNVMSFGRRLNTIERVWFRLVKTVTAGDVLAKYWLTTQWSKAALLSDRFTVILSQFSL